LHIKSLINVAKTIDEENKRDSRVIECMVNHLEKSYKAQKEAIKSLQNEFRIDLNGNEKKLSLRNRNLGDKGLKLISKIIFKNLKEIDVSENNIKNIEPLNEMNLPHLEYLNMSDNQIANINPIAELNAKNLKEISLQNNNIQDIEPFLKSDFPALERLRIENQNNRIDTSDKSFKDFINKFENKVFYVE
jgi:Leucine-rich repeat (LRR) protein